MIFGLGKYRIVQKQTTKTLSNGQVEINTYYVTQRLGIFGWSQVTFQGAEPQILTKYFDNVDWAFLSGFKTNARVDELRHAQQTLFILENPYSERYKGRKIVKLVGSKVIDGKVDVAPMYVITNKKVGGIYNEYSYSLNDLKAKIDQECAAKSKLTSAVIE